VAGATPRTRVREQVRGLYAITPEGLDDATLFSLTEAALAGGARLVQYRDKSRDAARRRAQAGALLTLCERHGAALVINDDVALALAIGAHGVHMGREDGDLREARRRLGADRLLGASCYADMALARAALDAGADHVAFGAAYASATKPGATHAGIDVYRAARAALDAPVVAIGGITPANALPLLDAGVDALAVVGALYDAADAAGVRAAASSFANLFRNPIP
jgi:thiamine-phosphate pyrophosphorylase